MKNFKPRKLLLMLALVFFIQNGVIVLPNVPGDDYSEGETVSPCSDIPPDNIYIP